MPGINQGLFKGVAVVIDDQAHERTDPHLVAILDTIHAAGGLAIVHTALPTGIDLANYAGVAFVVMDWDLTPPGTDLPASTREALFEENVQFIRELGAHRHTPVVIFTNERLEDVQEVLNAHDDMRGHLQSRRLLLKDKAEVGDKLYDVLNAWANEVPSVLTLKTWEHESIRAVNDLFIDLHDRSPHWPVMLWDTYQDDGASPADDLGRLITRLVASRMNPLDLTLDAFVASVEAEHAADPAGYEATLKRVLEGERVLESKRLHADSIAPGDFFKRPNDKALYINVRPECDVVIRAGKPAPDLYLLKGERARKVNIGQYGEIIDSDPKYTIFAMFEGNAYCFDFKHLLVGTWADWKEHRKGRLLHPFSTRLQGKYSAYLQRTGLPTVPKMLRPKADPVPAGS
jgi:hypothetical protein